MREGSMIKIFSNVLMKNLGRTWWQANNH